MSQVPTTLSALFAATVLAAPLSAQQAESAGFPGAVRGEQALQALGDRLADVAAAHDLDAQELRETLQRDETLWLTPDDQLVFLDTPPARPEASGGSFAGGASIPLEDAFFLHSNPGADHVIFLDFDGHHSKNNGWGHNIVFPPFNTSGSSSTFTNGELTEIIDTWQLVAEDFAPYAVDVTTEEPPEDYLRKNLFMDQHWGVRVLMTQYTDGFGNGTGGIALLGSFNDFFDTPCFAFNKGVNNGSMTASHEAGHTLGLQHDGLNGSTYHPGSGSGATGWGPIMGAPFGKTVVQWSNGDYSGSTSTQADLNVIAGSVGGFGYLPDDFGDDVGDASPLPLACPDLSTTTFAGVIERTDDTDAFAFSTSGGTLTVSATPFTLGPNLDIELELLTAGGAVVATNGPNSLTTASLSETLAAGDYVLVIDGEGKSGSYSDYGSVGQYTLTVSGSLGGNSFNPVGAGLAGTGGLVPALTGSGVACDGESVSLDLSDALGSASAFLVIGIGQLNLPFKGGTLIPDITLGAIFALVTSPGGDIALPFTWSDLPSGLAVDYQYWIQDAGGPVGFSASNGVEVIVP